MSTEIIIAGTAVVTVSLTLLGVAWKRANTEGADASEQVELRRDVDALMLEKVKTQEFCSMQTVRNEQQKEINTNHGQRLAGIESRVSLSEGREQGRREGR